MAHDITKDVIGVKEFEVQDINKSGEPASFHGSITLDNHIVNKVYIDTLTTDHPHQDVTTTAEPVFDGITLFPSQQTTFTQVDNDNIMSVANQTMVFSTGRTQDVIIFKPNNTSAFTVSDTSLRINSDKLQFSEPRGFVYDSSANDLGIVMDNSMDFANASVIFTDSGNVIMKGDLNVDGEVKANELTITAPSAQNYKFTNGVLATTLAIEGQVDDVGVHLAMFTKKGDGGDNVQLRLYGKGTTASITNNEVLRFLYKASDTDFSISSLAGGTGTVRPLKFFTGTNTTQFILNTDGSITMGGGDLLFRNAGTGLLYGEISVNDNTTITSVSSAGFTQFLHFNTNGHSNNTTNDHTNDHILIREAGIYTIDCCVNIKNDSGAAHDIEVVISKNNNATIFPNLRRHRTLGTGSDIGAIPLCGHVSLDEDDTIEVWITSDSGSARNVIAEDVTLMVTMIGGS